MIPQRLAWARIMRFLPYSFRRRNSPIRQILLSRRELSSISIKGGGQFKVGRRRHEYGSEWYACGIAATTPGQNESAISSHPSNDGDYKQTCSQKKGEEALHQRLRISRNGGRSIERRELVIYRVERGTWEVDVEYTRRRSFICVYIRDQKSIPQLDRDGRSLPRNTQGGRYIHGWLVHVLHKLGIHFASCRLPPHSSPALTWCVAEFFICISCYVFYSVLSSRIGQLFSQEIMRNEEKYYLNPTYGVSLEVITYLSVTLASQLVHMYVQHPTSDFNPCPCIS